MEEIKFRNISKIALLVLFIITAISGFLASRLGFDYDFENFFPHNDPETEFFRSFRYHFESDNDYIIVAIDNETGTFNNAFLTKVDSMNRVFDALENVDTVVSPTRMTQPLRDPFAGVERSPAPAPAANPAKLPHSIPLARAPAAAANP